MLGLNTTAQPTGSALIKDTTEASFMTDVIDTSQSVPVIVDFWSPRSGASTPSSSALEAAVTAQKGAVRMVKINVDENQRIAEQLRIQSLPTVYAFWQGKPVDGYQGAKLSSEIDAFIARVITASGGVPGAGLSEAIEAAEAMLAEGAAIDAAETFAAVLGEEPENAAAYGGLIRAHLALGEIEQADTILANAPPTLAQSKEVETARAQIALARAANDAGPISELMAKLDANPDDHQTRFDLASALVAAKRSDEAVDHLLDLFQRARDWNDGAAKTQLLTIFDALDPKDPLVLRGRRRMSSLIFA